MGVVGLNDIEGGEAYGMISCTSPTLSLVTDFLKGSSEVLARLSVIMPSRIIISTFPAARAMDAKLS